jgi:hypothetical protein
MRLEGAHKVIFQSMKKTLKAFPNIVTQEIMLWNIMDDPIVITLVQNHDTFFENAIIKRELVIGLIQSLSKAKRPYTSSSWSQNMPF